MLNRLVILRIAFAALLLGVAGGCAGSRSVSRLDEARKAYTAERWDDSFSLAAGVAEGGPDAERHEAAYLAGLSAIRMRHFGTAERFLSATAESSDPTLRADGQATLGMLYARQQRFDRASDMFMAAGESMVGEERAEAYFHAAMAQQKLGWWPQARATLTVARQHTRRPALIQRIENHLATTGYTIQAGAFADADRAKLHAQTFVADAERLKLGLPRVIPGPDSGGRTVHRVLIGRFPTYTVATMARERFTDADTIVVAMAGE